MQFIHREQVEQILSSATCLQLSREAFTLMSRGKVKQTLRSVIASEQGSLMGTMPAYIEDGPYAGFGLKTVRVDFNHHNQSTSHEGCILLYDATDEGGIVLVDAASVTELRTAAASALATDLLAHQNASHLAILGTGVQARKHVQMIMAVRAITYISVWGRSRAGAAQFAAWCQHYSGLPVTVAETPAQAIAQADIICTVTAAKAPFLRASDLPARCHINAVGASAPGFQEVAPDIYTAVNLYLDSREAVWNASSCLLKAKQQGLLLQDASGTEIGTLLTSGDRPDLPVSQRTLFKSVGLAVQDLVFARAIVAGSRSAMNNTLK